MTRFFSVLLAAALNVQSLAAYGPPASVFLSNSSHQSVVQDQALSPLFLWERLAPLTPALKNIRHWAVTLARSNPQVLRHRAGAIGLALIEHMVLTHQLNLTYRSYMNGILGDKITYGTAIKSTIDAESMLLPVEALLGGRTLGSAQRALMDQIIAWARQHPLPVVEYETPSDPLTPLAAGSESGIALSTLLHDNGVARVHELFEARFRTLSEIEQRPYLRRIIDSLSLSADHDYVTHMAGRMAGLKNATPAEELEIQFHYAVRAFTRDIFPIEDRVLTQLIKTYRARFNEISNEEPDAKSFNASDVFYYLWKVGSHRGVSFFTDGPLDGQQLAAYELLVDLGVAKKETRYQTTVYQLVRQPINHRQGTAIGNILEYIPESPDKAQIQAAKDAIELHFQATGTIEAVNSLVPGQRVSLKKYFTDLSDRENEAGVQSVMLMVKDRLGSNRILIDEEFDQDQYLLEEISIQFWGGRLLRLKRERNRRWSIAQEKILSWPPTQTIAPGDVLMDLAQWASPVDEGVIDMQQMWPRDSFISYASLPAHILKAIYVHFDLDEKTWEPRILRAVTIGKWMEILGVLVFAVALWLGDIRPEVVCAILASYGLVHWPLITYTHRAAGIDPNWRDIFATLLFETYGVILLAMGRIHPAFGLLLLPALGMQYRFDTRHTLRSKHPVSWITRLPVFLTGLFVAISGQLGGAWKTLLRLPTFQNRTSKAA